MGGRRRSAMLLDERDGVLDGQDLLRRIVGNLAAELFFERHHELDRVEAVRPEIIDEARILGDLGLLDPEMFHHDFLYALGDVTHFSVSLDTQDFGSLWRAAACQNSGIRPGQPAKKAPFRNTLWRAWPASGGPCGGSKHGHSTVDVKGLSGHVSGL